MAEAKKIDNKKLYTQEQKERLEILYKILPIAGNLPTAFAMIDQIDFWLKKEHN